MYLGMPKAGDIVGYIFQADTWCPDCIRELALSQINYGEGVLASWSSDKTTEEILNEWSKEIGVNPEDESSYDSGEFPKVILVSDVEDTEHCGQCLEDI